MLPLYTPLHVLTWTCPWCNPRSRIAVAKLIRQVKYFFVNWNTTQSSFATLSRLLAWLWFLQFKKWENSQNYRSTKETINRGIKTIKWKKPVTWKYCTLPGWTPSAYRLCESWLHPGDVYIFTETAETRVMHKMNFDAGTKTTFHWSTRSQILKNIKISKFFL